jgi:hypothetical protein
MDHGGGEAENRSPVLVFHWRRIFCIFWWLETENRNGVPYRCSVRVSLRLSTTDSQKRKMGLHCSSLKHLQWSTDPHSLFSVVPPTRRRNEARLLSLLCLSAELAPPFSPPPWPLAPLHNAAHPFSPMKRRSEEQKGAEARRHGRRAAEELLLLEVAALAFLLEYATTKFRSVGKAAQGSTVNRRAPPPPGRCARLPS